VTTATTTHTAQKVSDKNRERRASINRAAVYTPWAIKKVPLVFLR